MFPIFIQVALYLRGGIYTKGGYIRDVKWAAYLGGAYSGDLYTGGRINGVIRYTTNYKLILIYQLRKNGGRTVHTM